MVPLRAAGPRIRYTTRLYPAWQSASHGTYNRRRNPTLNKLDKLSSIRKRSENTSPRDHSEAPSIRYVDTQEEYKPTNEYSLREREHIEEVQSLYEDLFSHNVARHAGEAIEGRATKRETIPRLRPTLSTLSLPISGKSLLTYHASDMDTPRHRVPGSTIATPAKYPVIMVLYHAGKSLTDADFRRLAPKRATHLPEWNGPGAILKALPARDQYTLEQSNFYYLFFSNYAQAVIFQRHWRDLHRVVQIYTPTDISSALSFPSTDIEGQEDLEHGLKRPNKERIGTPSFPMVKGTSLGLESNVDEPSIVDDHLISKILRDYAVLPATITLQNPINTCGPTSALRSMSQDKGYPAITRQGWRRKEDVNVASAAGMLPNRALNERLVSQDRTSRAVRFHFQGCQQPGLVLALLKADGADRGMAWDCEIESRSMFREPDQEKEKDEGEEDERNVGRVASQGGGRRGEMYWILTFVDEDNARRFVRRWHKRIISHGKHAEDVAASADLLW